MKRGTDIDFDTTYFQLKANSRSYFAGDAYSLTNC